VRVRDGEVEQLEQGILEGDRPRRHHRTAARVHVRNRSLQGRAPGAGPESRGPCQRAAKDAANGLPRGAQLGAAAVGEYDPAIEEISPDWIAPGGREAEKAARAEDARVRKFDSTGAGDFLSRSAIFSSHGARRGIARVLCLRVLLPRWRRRTGSCRPRRGATRAARWPGCSGRRRWPHRRPPGRSDAGRAQAEDAAGACRVRTAAGGGIHRRHLLRRERPCGRCMLQRSVVTSVTPGAATRLPSSARESSTSCARAGRSRRRRCRR